VDQQEPKRRERELKEQWQLRNAFRTDLLELAEKEKSLILAQELKDRVVGKGNEKENKEKKEGKMRESCCFCLY